MMQQYLKLGDTEKALDCLKQMVEAAVGPAMTPNPALFYPTLAPKKSAKKSANPNAAGTARHASARSAGG